MIVWLSHWARALLAVAVFGLLVELLLPNRAHEGYVRLVVGLAVVAAILGPLTGLVRTGRLAAPRLEWGGGAGAAALRRAESAYTRTSEREVMDAFAAEVGRAAAAAACTVPRVSRCRATAAVTANPASADYGRLGRVTVWARAPTGAKAQIARAVAAAIGETPDQVRLILSGASGRGNRG